MTPPLRGTQENSGERARNLSGTAMRMLRRLAPMRFTVIAILALSVSGIAIAAISPRILGHATDLIFDGVIGARLPSGIDKAQAVAEATPCWPAPVSAITRVLPIRLVSNACPIVLLIL